MSWHLPAQTCVLQCNAVIFSDSHAWMNELSTYSTLSCLSLPGNASRLTACHQQQLLCGCCQLQQLLLQHNHQFMQCMPASLQQQYNSTHCMHHIHFVTHLTFTIKTRAGTLSEPVWRMLAVAWAGSTMLLVTSNKPLCIAAALDAGHAAALLLPLPGENDFVPKAAPVCHFFPVCREEAMALLQVNFWTVKFAVVCTQIRS